MSSRQSGGERKEIVEKSKEERRAFNLEQSSVQNKTGNFRGRGGGDGRSILKAYLITKKKDKGGGRLVEIETQWR